MSYKKLVQYINNSLISDDEALDRLEDMLVNHVINRSQFCFAKDLLF